MRATAVAVFLFASTVHAGTPDRIALNLSGGGVFEDLGEVSHIYQMGPTASYSAGVEVFNKDHWLSLQAGLTYNHNTMTDESYLEYATMNTYTPSVMIKINPIRRAKWLWGGIRLGVVRLEHSDSKNTDGEGHAEGWGYLTQGNLILAITQHRHMAINLEAGYQIANLYNVTYSQPDYYSGPLSYPLDFQLSGPRIALGVSLFP